MTVWIATLIITSALTGGGYYCYHYISEEHKEAKNISIDTAPFSGMKDGTYEGNYKGGMYGWRKNKISIKVDNGLVSYITVIKTKDPGIENSNLVELFKRVIKAQSLKVDTITGATLTCKAHLKSIEAAVYKSKEKSKL